MPGNVPQKVEDIVKALKRENPDWEEEKYWKIAWSTYNKMSEDINLDPLAYLLESEEISEAQIRPDSLMVIDIKQMFKYLEQASDAAFDAHQRELTGDDSIANEGTYKAMQNLKKAKSSLEAIMKNYSRNADPEQSLAIHRGFSSRKPR
jgi:hypothetical protein